MRPKIGLWWDTGLQPYHWRPYMCSETTQQWKNDGSRPCITRHYKTILTQFVLRARLPTPYLGAKIPDCTIRFDLRQWKQSLKYRLYSESLPPGIYVKIWSPVPSSDMAPCLPYSVSKIRIKFAFFTVLFDRDLLAWYACTMDLAFRNKLGIYTVRVMRISWVADDRLRAMKKNESA